MQVAALSDAGHSLSGRLVARRALWNCEMRTYVAWFERADWDEIKRLCADDLQDTFDEWLASAEAGPIEYGTSLLLA
jgi:hypothetical protein